MSALPRQAGTGAAFDPRRNTSAVHAVPPNALPEYGRALRAFREFEPDLYRWVVEGHPNLTEAGHLRRFGEPYTSRKAKR